MHDTSGSPTPLPRGSRLTVLSEQRHTVLAPFQWALYGMASICASNEQHCGRPRALIRVSFLLFVDLEVLRCF